VYELTIKGDFSSAHFLRGYQGKCRNLHGHTWKIELTLVSKKLDRLGMVVDFKIVKGQLREFLDGIDHACLNDLPYFKKVNPTTENLAKYIYVEFLKVCRPLKLKKVQVWESENSSVIYYR